MERAIYEEYVKILKEELVMAMGCTEPIAVAYAAALASRALGSKPESIEVLVSKNIIKNVKSVVVPCSGGLRGIKAAVCAGIVAAKPEKELEILADVTESQKEEMKEMMENIPITVKESDSGYVFDIQIRTLAGGHTGYVQISGYHTNVIRLMRDGEVLSEKDYTEQQPIQSTNHDLLNVENIIEFADCVDIKDVEEVLERQI